MSKNVFTEEDPKELRKQIWQSTFLSFEHSIKLQNLAAFCPHCNSTIQFGDITLKQESKLHRDHGYHIRDLITSRYEAVLPISPDNYDNSDLAVEIHCYDCGHKMILIPSHLQSVIESFNNLKFFTTGKYFEDTHCGGCLDSVIVETINRKIFFKDINFLLVALYDFCNANPDKVECGFVDPIVCDSRNVPRTAVLIPHSEEYKDISRIIIARFDDDHGGCIRYDQNYEKCNMVILNTHAKNDTQMKECQYPKLTQNFVNAVSLIAGMVSDWASYTDEDFSKIPTNPFIDFYRAEYKKLIMDNVTAADSYQWFTCGHDFKYPAVTPIVGSVSLS